MSKNYRGYISVTAANQFSTRNTLKGVSNLRDDILDTDTNPPLNATGGTIETSPTHKTHIFTSPGNFVVSDGTQSVEYCIVGGGGGGGAGGSSDFGRAGGGGGGGGVITTFTTVGPDGFQASPYPVSPGTYPIAVGAGGAGKSGTTPGQATPGGDSTAFGLTGQGGGGGGHGRNQPGDPGGSGGGASARELGTAGGGVGTSSQGYPGGDNTTESNNAGGGGGAGGVGASVPSYPAGIGDGGNGRSIGDVVPSSYGTPGPSPGRWFAGGGAGFTSSSPRAANGGAGGGGDDLGPTEVTSLLNGDTNTGGGAAGNGDGRTGGTGGSGIVIIRYEI